MHIGGLDSPQSIIFRQPAGNFGRSSVPMECHTNRHDVCAGLFKVIGRGEEKVVVNGEAFGLKIGTVAWWTFHSDRWKVPRQLPKQLTWTRWRR